MASADVPDSSTVFVDEQFRANNEVAEAEKWVRIGELYPQGANLTTLLPDKFSRDQFEQGDHFECFMLTAYSVLINHPDTIRNCFLTKKPRQDGRYRFQFFRFDKWHTVEIDDSIPIVEGDTVFIRSPTKHWWPVLLEKAYAKFYNGYSQVEGCTLQEALHDISGNPVMNVPLDAKLAAAAGAQVNDGAYWLDLSKKIRTGQLGVTSLSKRDAAEPFGMRDEQTYGIQEVVSLNGGTELVNLLVHLYSPFEEDQYSGPMNENDTLWTPALKAQFDPSRKNTIFLPIIEFLRIFGSLQVAYLKTVDITEALAFPDAWVANSTAGGNPTLISWRQNPMYIVRNTSDAPATIIAQIRQEDQRASHDPENDQLRYQQCGLVLSQASFRAEDPIATKYVCGNNHKSIHKGLFLNSREVANSITVPPKSLCYLVPTGMQRNPGKFVLGVYFLKGSGDKAKLTIERAKLDTMAWENPAMDELDLQPKSKDRVDFYVDAATDIHILLTQRKPFPLKSGGDNMTEDFCGMYLYNDTDKKIAGVSAATNFRETSLIHHVPSSGRYALSVTCPKGSGDVPITVTVVGSPQSRVRIVDAPADAKDLAGDDDDDDDDEEADLVDYVPRTYPDPSMNVPPDSDTPFEDRQFYMDNKDVTEHKWMHITDVYPSGKKKPLLPQKFESSQFEQGDHFECFMLTALSTLVRHPNVIRNCFVTQEVRRDGRYIFRFFRYGQWHFVEIDDRIPVVENNQTVFIRSPSEHWWPLLLEKAHAKFYNRYSNVEGCTLQEALHDLTGKPVLNIPFEDKLALAAGFDISDSAFWLDLGDKLETVACTALTRKELAEPLGMRDEQTYGISGIVRSNHRDEPTLDNLLVRLYCPFVEDTYTGPMNEDDTMWTGSMLETHRPQKSDIIMPVSEFVRVFASMQMCQIRDVVQPCYSFHSKWDESCSGGNPIYTSWKTNPQYIVENTSEDPIQMAFIIRQPDQRATIHVKNEEPQYTQCGLVMVQSNYKQPFPTHLMTSNNHRSAHKGLFLNSREVSNLVTVPPKSLCYLVPSPLQRGALSRFMLSYQFLFLGDDQHVSVRRHKSTMALDKPAIDELELVPRSKDRVDFEVDCQGEVHVLMSQLKPHQMKSGGDSMTEDYCGLYMYNDKNKKITGVAAATNYRDTGVVFQVPAKGRYALSVTCPKGAGKIPLRVTIVAIAAAHVRIVDPPEDAEEFMEVDLSFLDQEPEGVPIEVLNLDDDEKFEQMLKQLKLYYKNADANKANISKLEREMNLYVHVLAKRYIANERSKFLKVPDGYTLATFNPMLDDDDGFTKMEVTRFELKKNPRNATKVVTVERNLNARALEIANENSNPDRGWLGKDVRGVPIELLPLEDHAQLKEAEKRLRTARRGQTSKAEMDELEQTVRETIEEIADSYINHHRRVLNQDAHGVPIKKLPIDEDQQFRDLEIQRYRLIKQDPKKNERAIKDIEAKLNNRSLELADAEASKDRANILEREYHGIAVGQLNLAGDAAYLELQRKRMALLRSGGDEGKIRDLENKMRDRAEQLALAENEKDRAGVIGKSIDGVPTDQLDLSNDALFLAAEARRARLKRNGGSPAEIQAAENEMRLRAQLLAKQRMTSDRGYLHPNPEGVALSLLPLDSDGEFTRMEAERFALKADPKKNASKITAKEEDLNGRARELAKEYKQRGRSHLRGAYLGIPLDDLPLDTDEDMKELEAEKRNLGGQHPDTVREIDDAMNSRAGSLAEQMHADERKVHDQEPDGVPIDDLKLNDNKPFIDAENQIRRLKRDPKKNAAKIKELEGELQRMLKAAARAEIEASRDFLDPDPRGIPLSQIPFDQDAKFKALEKERRKRRKRLGQDAPEVIQLEDEMNERILELADEYISNDRGYLPSELEGVPTADVPVGSDDAFRALEVERSRLKANKGSSKAIQDSEGKLVARGKALALEMLARERNDFNPQPSGVSLASILPIAHQDKQFRSLENQRRRKRRERDEDGWSELTGDAGTRIEELAREAVKGERKQYLNKEYEGVPTGELPLDRDDEFRGLEAERFDEIKKSKPDTRKVVDTEKRIHARAAEIAKQYLESDLDSFLDPEPRGVLLSELPLDSDKAFQDMKRERARLKGQDAGKNAARIAELQGKMNARCDGLAYDALKKDRPKFLEMEPRGVPLDYLNIDNDDQFKDLERKRWRMKRAGKTKSPDFQALEDELGDMIDEMAEEYIRKEREFLDPNPDGVPLEFLAVDEDPVFRALEKERRPLLQPDEAAKGRKKSQELEQKMSDHAVKKARQLVQKDRSYMEPEPEGVPLADLPVDTDKEIYDGERKRQQLKKDAALNATGIADTEDQVNDRLIELAMRLYEKDRAYLDAEPEEVPLSNLPLNTDEEFRKLEIARRKAKANGDEKRAKDLEGKLNQRAHVLAKEWLANDRGYLDPEPEGVLQEYLPLHIDAKFRELEKQRSKLRKSGGGNVPEVEDKLNDRAHFLAKEVIAKERARILKPEYLGVPREYLPLDTNKEFRDVEKRRRAAERKKKDADEDRLLQNDMNEFATELAEQYLVEEREFLTPEPEGVPLADIGLDNDNLFKRMELDRRKRRHEPNAEEDDRIGEIEGKMSNRAHELARQLILGDRAFLNPEPHGVELEYLPLDTDGKFQRLENERRLEKRKPDVSPMELKELEDGMNDRAHELAKEFLAREREYLDPEPEGVPIAQLKLHQDKPFRTMELERRKLRKDPAKNEKKILDFEDRLNERARQLAREQRGYQDEDFHARNVNAANRWVRIAQLYPEGQNDKLLPDRPSGADVESAPEGAGFLAPYLAAMTRNFPLFHAMVETKVPNKREPFVFYFHSPTNGRTRIEVDDRVPVGKDGEPCFTRAPNRHWFPILTEKAYAKFRGGYRSLDHVTPHEALRDLTGKPVTHIPLEKKLAKASGVDPTHPKFWKGIRDDIARGDIVVAMSIWEAPDGIHKQSSYAIMTVVETIEGSTDPNDFYVRLHNSYKYAPYYNGPMHQDDRAWTPELVNLCKYDRSRSDTLFLPIPVFLRNFVSLQKCHANSGDPTVHPGEWDARTSGGNPNATGFRTNPIFVLENRGSRPTQVVLELRHKTSMQSGSIALSDDDDDAVRKRRRVREEKEEDGARSYPQTGIMVVQATTPFTVPTELIAWNCFKSIHKSMVLDSRELSFSFLAPPTTTCFVVPYTLRRGVTGTFDIAMYPFQGLFSFSPLNTAVVMQKPLEAEFDVPAVVDSEGVRLDFLCDDTSELHIMMQQTLPYDSGNRGDLHAANVAQMTLYDGHNSKIASTGDPSDYREQSILTRPLAPGRYALLFLSNKGHPPMFPVKVQIFASRKANLRWTPLPANAKPLVQSRFPMLPKSAPVNKGAPDYDDREDGARRGSVPLNWAHGEVNIHDEKVRKPKQFVELPALPSKPKPPPKKVYAFGTSSPRANVF